jgi:hypothetical protein
MTVVPVGCCAHTGNVASPEKWRVEVCLTPREHSQKMTFTKRTKLLGEFVISHFGNVMFCLTAI